MQVSLLGVPPDGTVVLIDRGTSVSINSITSAGTGASLIKSYNVGIITLKSLIANAPLSLAANTNDITFSIDLSAYTTTSGLTTVYTPLTRTISTTAPLTGGGDLSVNRTIAIPAANGSTSGYLSSTDWTTFNSKQASLVAASAGTNGYLTSTDWSTFNNKQPALGFTPVQNGGGITQLAGSTTVQIGADSVDANFLRASKFASSDYGRFLFDTNVNTSLQYTGQLQLPNNYIAVQSPDAVQLYTKVIDIGSWDMNTNASFSTAHGLSPDKIRSVKVVIRNDGTFDALPDNYYDLTTGNGSAFSGAATWSSSNGNINMNRVAGSIFQSSAFNFAPYNRGWITILYVP